MANKSSDSLTDEYVINLIKEKKPESVAQLVRLVQEKYPLTEQEVTKLLLRLENQGKIRFSRTDSKQLKASDSLSNKSIDLPINEYVINLVKEKKPESAEQLVGLVREKYPLTEQEITKLLLRLESQGKIRFSPKAYTISASPSKYVLSARTAWFWTTAILVIATVIAVFTVPENAYPLVYVRYVLGFIFVLWLPGYTFIKALFPTQVPIKTSSSSLDTIERVILSAGMNLALVPIVGLILNYTPWGITLTPITLSLLALTLTFAAVALAREYRERTKTE